MAETVAKKRKKKAENEAVNTHAEDLQQGVPQMLTEVIVRVNEKRMSGGERTALDALKEARIEVKVIANTDATNKDNSIKVGLYWNPEIGLEASREVSINTACENEEDIRQTLLNMGYLDDKGEVSRALIEVVKDKVRRRELSLTHNRIGMGKLKGRNIFKLHKIHTEAGIMDSEYTGDLSISQKGDIKGYIDGLKRLVVGRPKLLLALIVGVYGILLQFLGLPDCNLIINFFGKSSSANQKDNTGIGKSTAVKLCLMLFGNAKELFKNYNSTDNRIEADMAKHLVIPFVIDDKLVSSIGTSQRRLFSDLTKFVFRFVSGQVRGRLNDEKYKSFEKIHCPTVLTAEASIAEKMVGIDTSGQFSRIVEIPCMRGELTESKEHCEQLEEFIAGYEGVGAEAFIEFLFREKYFQSEETLNERYKAWVKKLNAGVLGSTAIGSRVADKVGLLMLSAELMEECFELGMDLGSIQKVLENSVQDVNESATFANRAYEHLVNYVKSNAERFVAACGDCVDSSEDSRNSDNVITHIGHYKNIQGVWQVWLLSRGIQEIFSEFQGFTNVVTLMRLWKDAKLLISGNDTENRFTQKRTFYQGDKQDNVYMIKMPEVLN